MTYAEVFGNTVVEISDPSYLALTLTQSLTLTWPSYSTSGTPMAKILEIVTASPGLTLTFPSALAVSVGYDVLVRNLGGYAVTVNNAGGTPIVTISPGQAWYLYLVDVSTASGAWRTLQFGTGTSVADAGSLAGYGLSVVNAKLGQTYAVTNLAGNYTVQPTDLSKVFVWTSGSGTFTLPTSSSVGAGFFVLLANSGTGAITITRTGSDLIDTVSSVTQNPDESALIVSTGTGWRTIGKGRSVQSTTTLLNLNVAGNSDITLTTTQAQNVFQVYSGTLTGNINVIVPSGVAVYYIFNNTTGSYTLTVKTPSGTGVVVPQAQHTIVNSDGTNVVSSITTVPAYSLTFPQGSSGAPGISVQGDPTTGLYQSAVGALDVSIAGTKVAEFTASGLTVTGSVLANGADLTALAIAFG